jgi:hypothetical protein
MDARLKTSYRRGRDLAYPSVHRQRQPLFLVIRLEHRNTCELTFNGTSASRDPKKKRQPW